MSYEYEFAVWCFLSVAHHLLLLMFKRPVGFTQSDTGGAHCSKLILTSSMSASSWYNCSSFCPAGCCCYRTSLLASCWLGDLSLFILNSDHMLCRQIERLERERVRKGNERLPRWSTVCTIFLLQKWPSGKGIPQIYVSDHVYVCVPFGDKNNWHFRVKASWLGLGLDVLWFGSG